MEGRATDSIRLSEHGEVFCAAVHYTPDLPAEGKINESVSQSGPEVSFLDKFGEGRKKDRKVRHYEVKNHQPNGT